MEKKIESITHAQLEVEKAKMIAEIIQAELHSKEEQQLRLKIGLTNLEGDANILRDALRKRQLELSDAVEMGKNNYVVKKAKLEVSNTRIMYNEVRKKIFTICLKHGVKSEHSD